MNSKERFSSKVLNYGKYRPTYPKELVNYLLREVGISTNAVIAEIGAGTGIFTKLLADKVKKIWAVEPNHNMRSACKDYCKELNNIAVLDGSAEKTGLLNHSVDYIITAQAFHWFDRNKAKLEFQRILQPNGKVILIWNRRAEEEPFIIENADLCKRVCPEFKGFAGGISYKPEAFHDFFRDGLCEYRVFENNRQLGLEAYIGASLSASYAPGENDSNYKEFIDGLQKLFAKYSRNGKILFPNRTHSYVGNI
ncbi:class I SAM-dependent methyltransferase [Desulfosporosinus sp. PR]|uniref:class I SAM-dependent methyltransferase n=1 Tax=Candidatus Desulfosporosinus nitrosoreducens TaxID=3401928 RepID=UPI0027F2847A|nr:class I SAM-dependent methyltransferase [Desulfosporosinus sp. PR]MDQ7092933.1 class I SAM-dependent methyltransferase [Desulfosporosinus sp. PR]